MIGLSINVLDLDKTRFKRVTLKSGKEALYCELVLIDTPNGQYGDYMVKQSVTKEERAARKEMPILGNAKVLGGGERRSPASAAPQSDSSEPPF